ncbi:MAG: hypothetical protein U5K76_12500 [Woeseiaceae bacterium]|nr:hypothetical protein [Woeseiaceae bacterium]
MALDRSKLYEDIDFFELHGHAVMMLTPEAAQKVCELASDQGLTIGRVEGGIWHDPGFEARLDRIWDVRDEARGECHVANHDAARFIRSWSDEHGVFILSILLRRLGGAFKFRNTDTGIESAGETRRQAWMSNQWKQTKTRGSYKETRYLDAMLRPVLVKTEDTSDGSGDLTRYSRTTFDSKSQPVFQSFPSASATAGDGSETDRRHPLIEIAERRSGVWPH